MQHHRSTHVGIEIGRVEAVIGVQLDELGDHAVQTGAHGQEVLVEAVFDAQRREDRVVDECRAQVGEHAGRVVALVVVQLTRDQKIEHRVAEEFEAL